jgi:hypothetical protein
MLQVNSEKGEGKGVASCCLPGNRNVMGELKKTWRKGQRMGKGRESETVP